MENLNTEFPATSIKHDYLKTSDFQDTEKTLKFLGWKKKGNADSGGKTWKDRLDYMLSYSYPQFALDKTGEKKLNKDGTPWQNRNWDSNYPQGYSIVYIFAEGELDSGSLPLFDAFCKARPKVGDQVTIGKTGKALETKWRVIVNEYKQADPSEKAPF